MCSIAKSVDPPPFETPGLASGDVFDCVARARKEKWELQATVARLLPKSRTAK